MTDKTGGPAFPKTPFVEIGTPQNGMTLRDYFAAKAMQAIIGREDNRFTTTLEFVGGKAYQFADAMLKARGQ
jgi:hypothetical protein